MQNPLHIYLICDESGGKGYADISESYPGETGVFAGYLLPAEHVEQVRFDLGEIISRIVGEDSEGKIHITDLEPEQQERLRYEIFQYFKNRNIVCINAAVHVEGFKANYDGTLERVLHSVILGFNAFKQC